MKKFIFLIGASGSGKTTTTKYIEKQGLIDFKVLHFDSIEVPSLEEMKTTYGSPENWQKAKTIEWVHLIKKEFLPNAHILFDAQTRPSFIEQACYESGVENFEVILLDCSDTERKKRLLHRGHSNLADENMMNWAKYLRKECMDRDYSIIDNSFMKIEETVSQLLMYIRELNSNM